MGRIDLLQLPAHHQADKLQLIRLRRVFGGHVLPVPQDGDPVAFGPVNITEEGFCLTDTGRLAGSAKPVLYGMKNLVCNMGKKLEEVCVMASLNPAQVYGFGDRKGSLAVNKDADFAVLDQNFNCLYTYSEGRKIYDHTIDTDLENPNAAKYR